MFSVSHFFVVPLRSYVQIFDIQEQYKANLKLALPVVLTQLGQVLVQFADNLMVGRYGGSDPLPLAAVSFGSSVFFIFFIAAVGITFGLTPLIGELYAQGDRKRRPSCCRAVWCSISASAC